MEYPGTWDRITAALASVYHPTRTDPDSLDRVWHVLVAQRLVRSDDASRDLFLRSTEEARRRPESPPMPGPSPWLVLADRLIAAGIVRRRGLQIPLGRRLTNAWRRLGARARR